MNWNWSSCLLFMQMATVPRTAKGHGWLRPAIGIVELSQCITQVFDFVLFKEFLCDRVK